MKPIQNLAGLAIVALLVLSSCTPKENSGETSFSESSFLKAPDYSAVVRPVNATLDIPSESFRIPSESGGELNYPSGTRILVPPHAFLHADGSPVTGEVEIRYREFHDPVDFMLSGIPMNYDSAGIAKHMESAGMMEIMGYQNGEPIFIDPEQPLEIEMASTNDGQNNLYFLNPESGNWEYNGRDQIKLEPLEMPSAEPTTTPEQMEKALASLEKEHQKVQLLEEPVAPLEPQMTTDKKNQFRLAVDVKDFPELEFYKDIVWEYAGDDEAQSPSKNEWVSQTTWAFAALAEHKNHRGSLYKLTLKNFKQQFEMVVRPVFDAEDMEEAKARYAEQFSLYKKKKAERERKEEQMALEIKQRKEALEQAKLDASHSAGQRNSLENSEMGKVAVYWEKTVLPENTPFTFSRFPVLSFGIYNLDHPIKTPIGAKIIAGVEVENGSQVIPSQLTLVQEDLNTTFPIALGYGRTVNTSYNPKKKSMLLFFLPDSRLAWAGPEDLASIQGNGSKGRKLLFHVSPNTLHSIDEVKLMVKEIAG